MTGMLIATGCAVIGLFAGVLGFVALCCCIFSSNYSQQEEQMLTKRRVEILTFIAGYINEHGYSPSMSDICMAVDLSSKSEAHRYLDSLEQMGYLKRTPKVGRSIVLNTERMSEIVEEVAA